MARRSSLSTIKRMVGVLPEQASVIAGSSSSTLHGSRGKATLPDLPYDYSALNPVIIPEIMELHHKKHHQTYVTNLNSFLEQLAEAEHAGDVNKMIALQSAIKFNGGGHLNHSMFWEMLCPPGSSDPLRGSCWI
eukprot:jgi/Picre1/28747/NNA_004146.t1